MEELLTAAALKANTDLIYSLANEFPEENFFKPSDSGGWSCAEVISHLIAVEKGVNYNLMGEWKESKLPPMSKAPLIEKIMADPDSKYKSPDALLPNVEGHSKADLLAKWLECRAVTSNVLDNFDLWPVITSMTHPAYGHLTRGEWIFFLIKHAERHARQIRNLITGFDY